MWKVVYARCHHFQLSIGSSAFAMGRFTLLLLALFHTVSAQRTSQGFQQQFRGPRLRQQSQIRSVGSQQPGRSRGARARQPTVVSTEQALADSFNFDIPFRTPADIVRAPGRFARALWDIEVGQYSELSPLQLTGLNYCT